MVNDAQVLCLKVSAEYVVVWYWFSFGNGSVCGYDHDHSKTMKSIK